jgi:hypothetical protein
MYKERRGRPKKIDHSILTVFLENIQCSNPYTAYYPEYTKIMITFSDISKLRRAVKNLIVNKFDLIRFNIYSDKYKLMKSIDPEEESVFHVQKNKAFVIVQRNHIYFSFTDTYSKPETTIHSDKITIDELYNKWKAQQPVKKSKHAKKKR